MVNRSRANVLLSSSTCSTTSHRFLRELGVSERGQNGTPPKSGIWGVYHSVQNPFPQDRSTYGFAAVAPSARRLFLQKIRGPTRKGRLDRTVQGVYHSVHGHQSRARSPGDTNEGVVLPLTHKHRYSSSSHGWRLPVSKIGAPLTSREVGIEEGKPD